MRPSDQEEIETLRRNLVLQMAQLDRLRVTAGVEALALTSVGLAPVEELDWDEEEEENSAPPPPAIPENNTNGGDLTPIESQPIILPSYGNTNGHVDAEIKSWISQASKQLSNLRELIVTKSFQYSDVIRPAPRKSVVTRSRQLIQNINEQITYHSQVYMECRNRLQKLNAEPRIMKYFQVLKKEDVRSSTAILNPNIPGSTTLRLSWLWESVTQRLEPGHFDSNINTDTNAEPNAERGPNADTNAPNTTPNQLNTSVAEPRAGENVNPEPVDVEPIETITRITDKPSLVECE